MNESEITMLRMFIEDSDSSDCSNSSELISAIESERESAYERNTYH